MAPTSFYILCALLGLYSARSESATKPWDPTPPCGPPLGVDEPAVPEAMCSAPLAQVGDVLLREYGLPAAATLVEVHVDGPEYYGVLVAGVSMIIQYFQGSNGDNKNFMGARTTPITMRNLADNNLTWIVGMMISTAAFPDAAAIPQASLPVELEQVGLRSLAVVQFNTTSPPVDADFKAACGKLLASPLPKGYTFNLSSSWSPTYVLYSAEAATFFTNECWAEVHKR